MPDTLPTRLHLEQILWAMHPSFLAQVTEKMERLSWSDEPQAKPAEPPQSILTVNEGVGIIPVSGTLMSEGHWLFPFLGDTSYESIQRAAKEAGDRADVQAVLTRTDSGGGFVPVMDETTEALRLLAQIKPLVAYNANQMSSAAYGINMHATHIVSAPAGKSGSIGTATLHREISGLEKRMGIKTTPIASGDLKRIANDWEPLTDEARAYMQGIINEHGKVFVEQTVAARKLTPEQKAEVARAGEFVGAQAVSVGLVDSLGLSAHVNGLLNLYKEKPSPAVFDLGRNSQGGTDMATAEELKAAQGAERKRIADIKALAPTGMEAFTESLAFAEEGYTVEQAGVLILKEQKVNPPKPKEEPKAAATPAVPAAATTEGLNKFMGEAPAPLVVATTEPAPSTATASQNYWDGLYSQVVASHNKNDTRGSFNLVRE